MRARMADEKTRRGNLSHPTEKQGHGMAGRKKHNFLYIKQTGIGRAGMAAWHGNLSNREESLVSPHLIYAQEAHGQGAWRENGGGGGRHGMAAWHNNENNGQAVAGAGLGETSSPEHFPSLSLS